MHLPLRALVVTLLIGLVACGGGSDGPLLSDPPGSDPFPLAAGAEWEYAFASNSGAAGRVVWRLFDLAVTGDDATFKWGETAATAVAFERSATEIRELPAADPAPLWAGLGPITVMRLPLTAGDRWTAVDARVRVDDGTGQGVDWQVTITFEVRALAEAQTRLGTFRGAFEVVRSETYQPLSGLSAATRVSVDRIVPGIGLVGREQSETPAGGVRPHLSIYELVAYRAP
jgi:hypothetical protein